MCRAAGQSDHRGSDGRKHTGCVMIGRLVVMVVALAGGTTAKLWGADPPERVAIQPPSVEQR